MSRDNAEIIYHYCSVDAFMKIIQTNSIWLSHVSTTNDSSEAKYYDRLVSSILKTQNERKIGENNYIDFIKRLSKKLRDTIDHPYIASFSREQNRLSQWRGYGDDGRGMAIGFDEKAIIPQPYLEGAEGEGDWSIGEVNYGFELQENELWSMIDNSYLQGGPPTPVETEAIILHLARKLKFKAALIKNPSFREESEVRIVYQPDSMVPQPEREDSPSRTSELKFRERSGEIVSYIEYFLPKESIKEVWAGPKSRVENHQFALFRASHQVLHGTKIARSNVPLR